MAREEISLCDQSMGHLADSNRSEPEQLSGC